MSDPNDFEDLLENFIGSSPARKTPTEPKNEPVKLEQKMELELQRPHHRMRQVEVKEKCSK